MKFYVLYDYAQTHGFFLPPLRPQLIGLLLLSPVGHGKDNISSFDNIE